MKAYVIYGESKNSLEKVIDLTFCPSCDKSIQIVNVIDDCNLVIDGVSYDTGKKSFVIDISNPSESECFANVEVFDVITNGEMHDYGTDKAVKIESHESKSVKVRAELDEVDLEENQIVNARALFGQRESALVKEFEGEFELKILSFAETLINNVSFVLLPVIAILLAGLVWVFIRVRNGKS